MTENEITTETTTPPPARPDPLALAYRVQGIPVWRQNLSARFMRTYLGFWGFVSAHWLAILNSVNALCLVAAFATPLLALAGLDGPANLLFGLFHYVCVQNPHHSFYIADRQMCLCQRCLAIYGGLLLAGLVFGLLRNRGNSLKPLKMGQFVLIFCLPIALDALTQLAGWRESTWELRFLTGGLFAVGATWMLYPLVQSRMLGLGRWVRQEYAQAGGLENHS